MMKFAFTHHHARTAQGSTDGWRSGRPARRQVGLALVLVLFILVLIATLIVGFLTLVSTERQASASYTDDARTRLLADTAVNLVIGQIRQATDNLNDDPAEPKTWASQPGMIRVFGISGGAGKGRADLQRGYKLYSSDAMVVSTFGNAEAAAELPPVDWKVKPSLFTDLNEPVRTTDPANPTTTKQRFPIFDPRAVGKISGVELISPPGADTEQPAPMPVKWLYLLKDGRYAAAQEMPGNTAKVRVEGATADNPIVGRLAFWTDDECAKVNINTASEGVFWDTPKANTVAERKFADYLPARFEFQRYPGHPATVSLSSVLGGFLTNTTGSTTAGTSAFGLYYDLAPRVQTGGSLDGNRTVTASSMNVVKDTDRLYATVDEYFFKAATLNQGQRATNSPELTTDVLAQTEFFLTAQSRAPEVTLFNTPRISLWPLQMVQPSGTLTARNAYDKLIGFCTSLGNDPSLPSTYPADQSRGYPYYYQRYQVGRVMDSSPVGASSPSTTDDYSKVQRNQTLYSYLQRLTAKNIPGFGGSFLAKYPNDRDQILTECFDYTRSLVNAISTPRQNLTPYYSYSPYYMDFGIVAPIRIGSTMGQGRFFTIAQAALLFYPTEVDVNGSDVVTRKMRARLVIQPYCVSPGASPFNQKFQVRVSGLDAFRADNATLGLKSGAIRSFNFNEGYYADNTNDFGPANKTALPSLNGHFFESKSSGTSRVSDPGQTANQFDVWASSADIDVTGKQSFQLTGGAVVLEIQAPGTTTVVQTLQLSFPNQSLPVPKRLGGLNDKGRQLVTGTTNRYTLDYRQRFFSSLKNQNTADPVYGRYEMNAKMLMENMIYPGDTVYAMAVNPNGKSRGDMRMLAYRPTIEAAYFTPQANLAGASLRVGCATNNGQFRKTWSENFKTSEAGGKLLSDLIYPEDAIPMVPPGLNGAQNRSGAPGDWDTGYDVQEDGPYVNKADEGSSTLGYFTRGAGLGYVAGAGWEAGALGSQGAEMDNLTFSPNRQIASAVMFGSLPTGVIGRDPAKNTPEPWQTLLFNPNPAAGTQHYGLTFPQDHLWLDLFWMPVVEPYAISEPFSTAGKVNMNYELMPFRYLKRRTALEAVLKGTRMTAIPDSDVATYKRQPVGTATNASSADYRLEISPDPNTGTLKGFEDRFNGGDIFRSASEICTISLVPKTGGATYAGMASWWSTRRLTGDNLRESPYNQLYPRLTTKSNTFTVHMRVQSLKKRQGSGAQDEWEESRDSVTGEYRGSCLIERYIDPNDPDLPDFASTNDTNKNGKSDDSETLDHYYKFRVIQRRQFAP